MITLEHVKQVRQNLSDAKNWNRNGGYFGERSQSSTCACIVGQFMLVTGMPVEVIDYSQVYNELSSDIRSRFPTPEGRAYLYPEGRAYLYPEEWNDTIATHEELLALLDRQIARMS